MFHLFVFQSCNLVYFPMSSVGVNYCLYLLSQENLVVLLALLLTLSKFVDVGLDPASVWKDLKHFLYAFFRSSFLAISSIDSGIFLLGTFLMIVFRS